MAETINGLNDAVQNRETITFTPGIGGEYGGRYEGPYLKVKTKMDQLIALGYAIQYECDASPIASLTFKTPNSSGQAPTNPNADYVDSFQIIRNTIAKDLMSSEHPLLTGVLGNNVNELKELIKGEKKATFNSTTLFCNEITGTKTFTSGRPTTSAAKAEYLFHLHRAGVTSVEVKQPILRVTRVTNPLYDVPFDLDYVDSVLKTSTMISDSKVPSNFVIGISNLADACSRRTLVTSVGYANRQDCLGFKFGWLKDAPTSETVGTSKNQYVLEYKFGLYDVETYGEPV
jgi:hypothetical protein